MGSDIQDAVSCADSAHSAHLPSTRSSAHENLGMSLSNSNAEII
jgi:hypothetical protein